jgi:hypothetical protein
METESDDSADITGLYTGIREEELKNTTKQAKKA